jgi:hypothetical protein
MDCHKCDYGNLSDALYCQQCGTPLRKKPHKILVLRPSQSLVVRHQLAGYYIGYGLWGLVGGVVLAVVAFLLFLFCCDCVGVTDPAGNSGALFGVGGFGDRCCVSLYRVRCESNKTFDQQTTAPSAFVSSAAHCARLIYDG